MEKVAFIIQILTIINQKVISLLILLLAMPKQTFQQTYG